MQLAILLDLVHSRGASLPDKRTALYDNYVTVFFDREAGKNHVVRRHRELLIDLHRYLGWTFHSEAETTDSRGRSSGERLNGLIIDFLVGERIDQSLADDIFGAVVERLHAIVSKTEGIYEFDVQPLREYFAARYLYDTAPYSPPGRERPGTKPDRFDALARNAYWLNVVRFFAGCFSRGEFECLVDRLRVLKNDPLFCFSANPYLLAAMLLEDWVFAQDSISTQAVVALLVDGLGIRFGKGDRENHRLPCVSLERECGSGEVVSRCLALLSRSLPAEFAQQVIAVLEANSSADETAVAWFAATAVSEEPLRTQWFHYGQWMGVFERQDETQLSLVMADTPYHPERLASIVGGGGARYVESDDDRLSALVFGVLDGRVTIDVREEGEMSLVGAFALAHDPRTYSSGLFPLLASKASGAIGIGHASHGRRESGVAYRCANLLRSFLQRSSAVEQEALARRVDLLAQFVEASRGEWGDHWVHFQLATAVAALRVGGVVAAARRNDLFASDIQLCSRARLGRQQREQPEWWANQLSGAVGEQEREFALSLLLCWADPLTIAVLAEPVERALDDLTRSGYDRVVRSVEPCRSFGRTSPRNVRDVNDLTLLPTELSARLAAALSARVGDATLESYFLKFRPTVFGTEVDVAIAEFVVRGELSRVGRSPDNWDVALDAVANWYQMQVVPSAVPFRSLLSGKLNPGTLPLRLARRIVSNAGEYPLDLVLAAEARCRASLSAAIRPVRSVADEDGWFERLP